MILDMVLSVVNFGLGLAIFIVNVLFYRRCDTSWRWVKMLYAVIGLLYTLLYLVVILNAVPDEYGFLFMSTVARPLITLTLSTILAGAILTLRRRGGNEC